MTVLGVDGCRAGWIGALVGGRTVRWLVLPDATSILAAAVAHSVEVVGVDIPIGLPQSGSRACDVAARARLGRAGPSVFPAPVRTVLDAATYADACARSRAANDPPRAISIQAWNLVAKIRDVDAELDAAACPIVEVHPEVSFRALDCGVRNPKRSALGRAQRVAALRRVIDVDEALATRPRRGVAVDDALDACAVAWTARRVTDGTADVLGDGASDALGRPMRIVV